MMNSMMHDDLLAEAREFFIEGNYRSAEPVLQQLRLQNTRNPEVYQMLATIYYDQGKFNQAIKTFKRALEIDPNYTDASVGLSIILNDLGRYEEGKKVFMDAQNLLDSKSGQPDPFIEEKFASKHEEMADLYFQYKRFDEAVAELSKAIEWTSSRKGEFGLRMAEIYVQSGQKEKAIRDLRRMILDQPSFIQARLKLGIIFYNSNNIAEAVEQWENILAIDPRHQEALKYLRMAQTAGITSVEL